MGKELVLRKTVKVCAGMLLLLGGVGAAYADGGVTFTNIAHGGGAGISYHRVASPDRLQDHQSQTQQVWPTAGFPASAQAESPQKWHGAPGIAIFDYDNDGDLDVYVTNGPGQPNSLYKNMLMETGHVSFVDVAAQAHVQLKNHDSSGVCFGDLDNDGFEDLYVLGSGYSNHLFHNNGNGTFTDITSSAGVAGDPTYYYSSCTMGDVNNDGYLDIVAGTTYHPWTNRHPVFVTGYIPGTEPDYLFLNNGNNTFTDASESSGIRNLLGDAVPNGENVTWAVALVDIDQDGDLDLMEAEDAGPGDHGRGYLRLLKNDGTGHFTDATFDLGLKVAGGFMGFAYGDFNCDGKLDFFVTDTGSYLTPMRPSRWYLQNADGTFTYPGLGDLKGTPFGWGASPIDYDNDGDVDIYYDGKVDMVLFMMGDNPGTILQNTGDCTATMTYDSKAILEDHRPRLVEGVAVGDINNDGFDDILTVSELNIDPVVNWFQFTKVAVPVPRSPIFDPIAFFELEYTRTPSGYVWLDPNVVDGDLSIEINSANNGNKWAQLTLRGAKGLTARGKVNRDGIGSVIRFTPDGAKTSIRAILGGSSYASEDSLRTTFGLGQKAKGTADILWAGGLHNKLYDVKAGEKLVVPEIPCDYANWTDNLGPHASRRDHRDQYQQCVQNALTDYNNQGLINKKVSARLLSSALRAFDDQTNH
jgi:enediyne biosynthesis protein E4